MKGGNEAMEGMGLFGRLCAGVILPIGDLLSRQRVMHHYDFFKNTQWWDRQRLRVLQNNLLRQTVELAYNETAFYRELYKKYGVKPRDIRTVEDLPKLPLVTKKMLSAAYPDHCVRKTNFPYREFHTSGSTGSPFVVRLDSESLSISRALMLLRANFSGWEIGDSYLQTGMTIERGFVKGLKDRLFRSSYVSAFNLSDNVIDLYLDLIESRRHKYIMGYASSLYLIAKRAGETGFNYSLKGAVSWGDNLFSNYRRAIEEQFKCRVTDTYGCGEGIQVAAQCHSGSYHIFTPHVAVEFTKNGMQVPHGEMGEVLLTRLHAGAMPLIRYSVGDMGRGGGNETCECGRGFELMRSIEGRHTDIVVTPSGNRLIVHFFTGIFEYATTIDTFQVVQEKPGEIKVRIVPRHDFKLEDWKRVEKEILVNGDPDLVIQLEIVQEIQLERSNKRRFVISRINT